MNENWGLWQITKFIISRTLLNIKFGKLSYSFLRSSKLMIRIWETFTERTYDAYFPSYI